MNFLNEALALKEILHVWGPVFCYRQGSSVIQRTLEEKMRSLGHTQWGHRCGVRQTGTAGGGHQGHILRSFTELSREFSCACRWCSAPAGLPRQGGQAADSAPGPSLHSLALWAAQQTHSTDLLNTFSGSSWRLSQVQTVCNPPLQCGE